jgi:hypothetical protein
MSVQPLREGFVTETPEPAPQPAPAPAAESQPGPAPADPAPVETEATADPLALSFPWTYPLRYKRIRGNKNEELSSLTFREPTAGDINRYGNPATMNAGGRFNPDPPIMFTMMAVLSGINQPLLERMDPRDWNFIAWRLMGFFVPLW